MPDKFELEPTFLPCLILFRHSNENPNDLKIKLFAHEKIISIQIIRVDSSINTLSVSQKKKTRHLKIYPKYTSNSTGTNVARPEIRLCGKWLQELGFESGDNIIVACQENCLLITLVKTC